MALTVAVNVTGWPNTEALGEDVTAFAPGDHIIARVTVYCGHCTMCLSGAPN